MMQPGPPWPREGSAVRGEAGELATEHTQLSLGSWGGEEGPAPLPRPGHPYRRVLWPCAPPLSPSYACRRSAWGRSWLSAPRRSGLTASPR